MSAVSAEPVEPAGPPIEPRLATRAKPPTPRRLSRRVLALSTGVGAVALAATLGFALTSSSHHGGEQEPVAVNNRQMSDALAGAPKDYSAARLAEAAKLPPPGSATATDVPATVPDPSSPQTADRNALLQQRRQRQESAQSSKLFAGDTSRPTSLADASGSASEAGAATAGAAPPTTGGGDAQDRKAAFVSGGAATPSINSGRLVPPAGRYALQAGATIAAALITGLSSDLPGAVVAQVTEDVFDSVTGRTRLIPQGSRLIGSYDAHVSFGQSRALVVWTRLIMPDGSSLDLDRLIGTDGAGQSGFADRVDHHTGTLLKAGLLSTLFGLGSSLSSSSNGSNGDIALAIRDSAGQSVERAGDKLVGHQLDVQPTIAIRPGARVRVLVSRDLLLAPWSDKGG